MESTNGQVRKGFRTPSKPTNGQLAKENATLSQDLKQKVENLNYTTQFLSQGMQQLMGAYRQMAPEVGALGVLATLEVASSDAEAAKGDAVMVDYLGCLMNDDGTPSVDANGLPQYQNSMYGLKFIIQNLGAGSLISGFEENVVGKKVGDTFEVNLQFPEQYQAKELQGKKVKFLIHIHRIYKMLSVSPVESTFAAYLEAKKAAEVASSQATETAPTENVTELQ